MKVMSKLSYYDLLTITQMLCSFRGEIRWMENFREKMRRKTFLECCLVGWGERKINGGARMFSPRAHQKVYFLKLREN